jgi:uncharacterized integral membrane protein
MPAQTSPPLGAARALPAPSANGFAPAPPGAARRRRPVVRTRISGIRTALITGGLALIVLVIFTVSLGVALLMAAIAGALLLAAAGTAPISQLRRAIHRTRRRGQPPAPATPGR